MSSPTATGAGEPSGAGDLVVAELNRLVARLGVLARHGVAGDDATRIERIAALERAKAAAGACQAA